MSKRIIVMGDYDKTYRPHRATNSALQHACNKLNTPAEITWLFTDKLENEGINLLNNADYIWAAPAPYKSKTGIFTGLQFARENKIPLLGTCGGMYYGLAEFAVNVLKIDDTYTNIDTSGTKNNQLFQRAACCNTGEFYQTNIIIKSNTHAYKAYQCKKITETSNCGFSFNHNYTELLKTYGMNCTAADDNGDAKIFEWQNHRFFVLTKYLPQMQSTQDMPHPLIMAFLNG